ncbi:V8-like Glu-specific endopeptidase [Streptococcus pneumoniae]|uniref:trypsin-like peptidase domain-containing protein n=8 Tax=Streptococcus pneumoniae TaxID=1313 RepID=UPI0008278154|nr:trypsin-like peptidase domain-containing protein [Streptococcus pneumoniae]NMG52224.1 choline-binding protein G [Streptococcus pneumoniae]NMH01653.1 choline-binding protein G [Streptococcus pneumoniae]OCQ80267.1 choline-binding protein G [Streptococcus pneumoniae]VIR01422.1 V8-like Glu-specific endopeptidase [Streptococcus pneumoniae]VJA56624.1 V8-like Glu-specific endopeptidase [Streptococcus pneumoniae]
MKKNFYKKLGISIIASTLLASQLSTVSALIVITNTGEEYEVSETFQESPEPSSYSLPDISPTYGQFFTSRPEAIIGSNDLVSIENTLQYPYSTSVYVESVFHGVKDGKNETYRGSANFIKDNILITAAHNIYKHEFGKDAEELYVTPAATPNNAPFGTVKVKKYYYLKNYVSDNPGTHSKNDLALLVLEEPIGTKTGTLGLSSLSTNLSGLNVTVTGYSALSEAVQMYTDTRNVIRDTGDFLYYNVDTYGGASGAAVYDASHRVVGVHIGTESRGSDIVNLAVKLNEQNLSFIYSVLEGHSIDGWKLISGTWYYYKNSTKQTGWQKINDTWYYLDASGKMLTDWQKVNGKWYYFESSGSMVTGWKYVRGRWYYLDNKNGDMKTGWYKDGSTWYYLDPSNGDMKTGWTKVNGKWYYLNSNGAMVTGSQTIDGKVYNFASSGEWI